MDTRFYVGSHRIEADETLRVTIRSQPNPAKLTRMIVHPDDGVWSDDLIISSIKCDDIEQLAESFDDSPPLTAERFSPAAIEHDLAFPFAREIRFEVKNTGGAFFDISLMLFGQIAVPSVGAVMFGEPSQFISFGEIIPASSMSTDELQPAPIQFTPSDVTYELISPDEM